MVLSHSANFVLCSNSDERSLHDLDPVNRGPGLQVQRGWHQEVGGRLGDRKNGPRRPNEWKKSVWKDGNVTEVAGDWPYFPLKRLCYGYTYRTYPYTSHLKRHPWICFSPWADPKLIRFNKQSWSRTSLLWRRFWLRRGLPETLISEFLPGTCAICAMVSCLRMTLLL